MSVSVTVNGTSYTIPETGETNWGSNVTTWIEAVSQHTLQKSGGTFTLTADVDFGATYGLKSSYFSTRSSNPATSGTVRNANDEGLGWRNAANDGNLTLKVNSSDLLDYDGDVVVVKESGSIKIDNDKGIDWRNNADNDDLTLKVNTSDQLEFNGNVINAATDTPNLLQNVGIQSSVAANALTLELKTKDGSDPSAGDPVKIAFRDSTVTAGGYYVRTVSSALSVVVPSGATLGHADGADEWVYLWAIDNGGTVVLGVSGGNGFLDHGIYSTTSIGTGSDSKSTMYSTSGVTSKAVRLLGRFASNQTTAGTWGSATTGDYLAGTFDSKIMCRYTSDTTTTITTSTVLPFEDIDYDTAGMYNPGTGVATTPVAGKYQITSAILSTSGTSNAINDGIGIRLEIDGASGIYLDVDYACTTSSRAKSANGTITLDLTAGQTIEIVGFNDTGQSHTLSGSAIQNYIEIVRIGD